jgi:hypothetical protein
MPNCNGETKKYGYQPADDEGTKVIRQDGYQPLDAGDGKGYKPIAESGGAEESNPPSGGSSVSKPK